MSRFDYGIFALLTGACTALAVVMFCKDPGLPTAGLVVYGLILLANFGIRAWPR